jgi:hypothetical protein
MRAMCIFQGKSGLPEDRFVNVFHFDTLVATKAFAEDWIADHLVSFYAGDPDGAGTALSVGSYFSPYVDRAANKAEIRVYDLADPQPRVPYIRNFTLPAPAASSTSGLPEEVAACLSFKAAPPVTPRKRGRIYFGPLVSGVTVMPTGLVGTRLDAAIRTSLTSAAVTHLCQTVSGDPRWSIYSDPGPHPDTPDEPRAAGLYHVVSVWADDAFDVQRRRGPVASVRTTANLTLL